MGGMRPRRPLLAAVILVLLAISGVILWMLRDPEPVFARRSGPLAAVDTLPRADHERDGTLVLRLRAETGLAATLAVRPAVLGPTAGEVAPTADATDATDAAGAPDTGRHPLVLILGGQQRGRGAVALVDSIPGVVLAALDYPYEGNPAPRGLVATLAQVPAIRRAFYDTPPAVSLALDHLLQRPDVDPTHHAPLAGPRGRTPLPPPRRVTAPRRAVADPTPRPRRARHTSHLGAAIRAGTLDRARRPTARRLPRLA